MLPFEFTVDGPPVSQQARPRTRLQDWKRFVRAEASKRWPSGTLPISAPVQIIVVYYHDGPSVSIDDDNMVKPIQDALNGLVYVDDNLIVDTTIRKTDLNGSFKLHGLSRVLAEGFIRNREFIYVRVEEALDHEELL
ncbi:MAG: crossover junction endodeoxyribonuclease RusA [Chthonomonadales bacterium]|nr:crossover junction endodeoxyribonuclease RusA [Chthonomonadales bacterium]